MATKRMKTTRTTEYNANSNRWRVVQHFSDGSWTRLRGAYKTKEEAEQAAAPATPGFAIELKDDTDLGVAMLVAEFGDGKYEPIGAVVSINEAREIAASDMRGRMRDLEAGQYPACPEIYVVWAAGIEGEYKVAKRFMP